MSEFDVEPVHGLPERLPDGEALRWQGAPTMGALARRAFHVRTIALYFGLLILLRVVLLLTGGGTFHEAVLSALWLATIAGLAIAILALLAWLYSRSTVYSVTDRRVVIRFGVALPMAVNIPFKVIEGAGLRTYSDGTGDITLSLAPGQRINYLIMWPNVRPWRILTPQPMLRCIPDAERVADILGAALREAVAADESAPQNSPGAGTGAASGDDPEGSVGETAAQPAGR